MKNLSLKCIALFALCSLAMAAPAPQDSLDELNPVAVAVGVSNRIIIDNF